MKVKTADLIDAALDYATLFAQGATETDLAPLVQDVVEDPGRRVLKNSPSTDWSRGGPLIAQYIFLLEDLGDYEWEATATNGCKYRGDTVLQAVCRACVASQFGEEVDVPEELLK